MSRVRVLAALRQIGEDGWPASVREVAAAAGLASKSSAHEHLYALREKGLAERNPRGDGWRAVERGDRLSR